MIDKSNLGEIIMFIKQVKESYIHAKSGRNRRIM